MINEKAASFNMKNIATAAAAKIIRISFPSQTSFFQFQTEHGETPQPSAKLKMGMSGYKKKGLVTSPESPNES